MNVAKNAIFTLLQKSQKVTEDIFGNGSKVWIQASNRVYSEKYNFILYE